MAPSRARIAVAAAVAAAMALASTASANDRIRDLRRQRDTDRAAAAAAVRETNLLQAEDAELAEALANISESIDAQQVRVGRAHQELAAAEQELLERLAVLDATEAERGWLQEELARMAVESYVGVGTNLQESWLDSDDLNATAIRLTLLDAAAGRDRNVLDRLRTLEAERQSQAAEAARLRDEASGLRQAVEEELAELEQWHRLRQDLKAEVQVRIDEWERAAAQRSQDALDMTALIRRTWWSCWGSTSATRPRPRSRGSSPPSTPKSGLGSGCGGTRSSGSGACTTASITGHPSAPPSGRPRPAPSSSRDGRAVTATPW